MSIILTMYTEEELEDFARWCILKEYRLGYVAGTWKSGDMKNHTMPEMVKMWRKDTGASIMKLRSDNMKCKL